MFRIIFLNYGKKVYLKKQTSSLKKGVNTYAKQCTYL